MEGRETIDVNYRRCFSTNRAHMFLVKGTGSLLLPGPECGRSFR